LYRGREADQSRQKKVLEDIVRRAVREALREYGILRGSLPMPIGNDSPQGGGAPRPSGAGWADDRDTKAIIETLNTISTCQ
jgi:hypothetical protein